jgi:hypothetical protein
MNFQPSYDIDLRPRIYPSVTQISWFMQSLLHAGATQNIPLNSSLSSILEQAHKMNITLLSLN